MTAVGVMKDSCAALEKLPASATRMKVSSCELYIDPPVTHYVPYIPHGYIHHSNVNFSHVSKRRSVVFEKSPLRRRPWSI